MKDTASPDKTAPELRSAWRFSLFQQFAIVVTIIALSKSVYIYAAIIALAIYWAGVGFVVFLRRSKPILIDLLFVRWSFPFLWLLALLLLVRISKIGTH